LLSFLALVALGQWLDIPRFNFGNEDVPGWLALFVSRSSSSQHPDD
jgi:hypothetical protein